MLNESDAISTDMKLKSMEWLVGDDNDKCEMECLCVQRCDVVMYVDNPVHVNVENPEAICMNGLWNANIISCVAASTLSNVAVKNTVKTKCVMTAG